MPAADEDSVNRFGQGGPWSPDSPLPTGSDPYGEDPYFPDPYA